MTAIATDKRGHLYILAKAPADWSPTEQEDRNRYVVNRMVQLERGIQAASGAKFDTLVAEFEELAAELEGQL